MPAKVTPEPVTESTACVPYTINVRLTKKCNADCSYCSSYQEVDGGWMSLDEFQTSLIEIMHIWTKIGVRPTHVSIQYLGGEISLVPLDVLEKIVWFARDVLQAYGCIVRDGVQSNLIMSKDKLDSIFKLFEGRVGTSLDSFTSQRTVNGSAGNYRKVFMMREEQYTPIDHVFPAVVVVDDVYKNHLLDELRGANRNRRCLTIKPVFAGGKSVRPTDTSELIDVFCSAFDAWFMKMSIIVEPFFSMVMRRLKHQHGIGGNDMSGCQFQNDCAYKSINLEPNGDLYLCQETADAGIGHFGNALRGEFDFDMWSLISERPQHLDDSCMNCDFLQECQGGCMAESIEHGSGTYGKPNTCSLWKALFKRIDDGVAEQGVTNVVKWLHMLEEYNKNDAAYS